MTVFFDSNALIYLAGNDARADRIEKMVKDGGIISVQVLNEVANTLRRKFAWEIGPTEQYLSKLRALFDVYPITLQTHAEGLAVHKRYGYSIWDSMIVASALLAGCNRLVSEDLSAGQKIRLPAAGGSAGDISLTVINPFTQPG